MADLQKLFTTAGAAEALEVKGRTLEAWRLRGTGPAFVRIGRAVRYKLDDLQRFIDAGRKAPGAGA